MTPEEALYDMAPVGFTYVCPACHKFSPNRAGFDPYTRRRIGSRGWGRSCVAKAVLKEISEIEAEEEG